MTKQVYFTLFFFNIFIFFSALAFAQQKLEVRKPAIQKGVIYQPVNNISEYWVSEKLDGVRGYWNGKQLFTRQGHIIHAPKWFTRHWPNLALDGELWIARNTFEQVSGIVRQQKPLDENWQKLHFMIFDLPKSKSVFSQRIQKMQILTKQANSPYLKVIKQQKFITTNKLFAYLDKVVADQGEGLMLHHQDALYKVGRTNHLMKLKKYQDAEAIVIDHIQGKGKFTNMLGALKVKAVNGIIFKIGSGFSDAQRKNPPAIGTQITYKYYGKTKNNVPRFASFMRIRPINE
jgi:DNA ligase-1